MNHISHGPAKSWFVATDAENSGRCRALQSEQNGVFWMECGIRKITLPVQTGFHPCGNIYFTAKACMLLLGHLRFGGCDIDTVFLKNHYMGW